MIVSGNTVRLTADEAVRGSEGARLSGDEAAYEFLARKSDVAMSHLLGGERPLDDPIDGVPEHLHLIEFPASPTLIERMAGYIAIGKEEDKDLGDLAEQALRGSTTQRRKPDVKARHRAPHLRIVQ